MSSLFVRRRGLRRIGERILFVVLAVLVPGTLLAMAFEVHRERELERESRAAVAIADARRLGHQAQIRSWLQSAHSAAEAACAEPGPTTDGHHLSLAQPLDAFLRRGSDTARDIIAPIRVESRVILGSSEGSHIDPALRGDPFFRQAPLDRFASLRVVSEATTEILAEQLRDFALTQGASIVLRVDRTLDAEGRMRVRAMHGEQPMFAAASRGRWILFVTGQPGSTGRDSVMLAMRFAETSRASWNFVDEAFVREVSCGELRVPLPQRLETAEGATLGISAAAERELEPTIELEGHRFAMVVSDEQQDAALAEDDDHRVEVLVLSAFCALGIFAYLAGVARSRRGRHARREALDDDAE